MAHSPRNLQPWRRQGFAVGGLLEDHQGAGLQQPGLGQHRQHTLQTGVSVWRVEHQQVVQAKAFLMASQPRVDRSAVYPTLGGSLGLLEERKVGSNHVHTAAVAVHEDACRRAPAEGLDAKASGAGVKVEHPGVDDLRPQDVE